MVGNIKEMILIMPTMNGIFALSAESQDLKTGVEMNKYRYEYYKGFLIGWCCAMAGFYLARCLINGG